MDSLDKTAKKILKIIEQSYPTETYENKIMLAVNAALNLSKSAGELVDDSLGDPAKGGKERLKKYLKGPGGQDFADALIREKTSGGEDKVIKPKRASKGLVDPSKGDPAEGGKKRLDEFFKSKQGKDIMEGAVGKQRSTKTKEHSIPAFKPKQASLLKLIIAAAEEDTLLHTALLEMGYSKNDLKQVFADSLDDDEPWETNAYSNLESFIKQAKGGFKPGKTDPGWSALDQEIYYAKNKNDIPGIKKKHRDRAKEIKKETGDLEKEVFSQGKNKAKLSDTTIPLPEKPANGIGELKAYNTIANFLKIASEDEVGPKEDVQELGESFGEASDKVKEGLDMKAYKVIKRAFDEFSDMYKNEDLQKLPNGGYVKTHNDNTCDNCGIDFKNGKCGCNRG